MSSDACLRLNPGGPFPKVCIVILNWNGWKDTLVCLDSLAGLDYSAFEIVVVDNGSTDESVERLSDRTDITLLKSGENLGFAGGCNVGVRYALQREFAYVWLLNNDTRVDSGALSALVDCAEANTQIGAVGSVLRDFSTNEIQAWGGGKVNFFTGRIKHFHHPVSRDSIDFLIGASLLIRRDVLTQDLTLDDQAFFLYWEDTDLGVRIRKAGWLLAVASASIVWHKESASTSLFSPFKHRFMGVSLVRFFRRHSAFSPWSISVALGVRVAKRISQGQWHCVKALLLGAMEELLDRPSTFRRVPPRHPEIVKA